MNIYEKDNVYFAAANTSGGFKSYFDKIFGKSELDKLYILKGGPGAGKSTFMKRLGKAATDMGEECEYFLCSSDSSSLDGIILKNKKVAVIDGTNPHSVEPSLSGVREIIIDLGRAWDTDGLYENKDVLSDLSDKKSSCYKECYGLLSCKSAMDNLIKRLVSPYIFASKLEKCADRICKTIFKNEACYSEKIRITKAISSAGKVRLSTFEDMANRTIFIKEPFEMSGISNLLLKRIYEKSKQANQHIIINFGVSDKGDVDSIYFPNISICVTKYNEEALLKCDKALKKSKVINCARFLDSKSFRHLSPLRRFYSKLSAKLEAQALDKLKEAGELHAQMEKIYGKHTNYNIVEEISKEYISKILA